MKKLFGILLFFNLLSCFVSKQNEYQNLELKLEGNFITDDTCVLKFQNSKKYDVKTMIISVLDSMGNKPKDYENKNVPGMVQANDTFLSLFFRNNILPRLKKGKYILNFETICGKVPDDFDERSLFPKVYKIKFERKDSIFRYNWTE